MRLDRAVGVQKQDPHRACVAPSIVVEGSADGQIDHAVAVEIAECGHRSAEVIVVIERAGESALGGAELLMRLDRAVGVQKQHPQGPPVETSIVVIWSADGEIVHTVVVEIAQTRHRGAKGVEIIECAGEAALGGAEF